MSRSTTDLTDLTASALVRAARSGELGVSEIVEQHIERIERINPSLNALAVERYEHATREAADADSHPQRRRRQALFGLPITVKECIDVAGTPSSGGVEHLSHKPRRFDAPAVCALRKAGAIVLGKTNLSQVLWFNESDNPVYGRTNNPWQAGRSAGGSSGGEAALIAAGGSPLGLGTDSGGSVRSPAHSCGIHALKPTSGRLTTRGTADDRIYPGLLRTLNQPGLLARSVDDLTLAYDTLIQTPRATHNAHSAHRDQLSPSLRHLRIGVFASHDEFPPSPAITRALTEAAQALEEAGASIEPFNPPDLSSALDLYNRLFNNDRGRALRAFLADSPIDPRVQAHLNELASAPPNPPSSRPTLELEIAAYQHEFSTALDAQRLDAVLSPPSALAALRHGQSETLSGCQCYAALFNLTGMPAGVIAATRVQKAEEHRNQTPIQTHDATWSAEHQSRGLPVGVQVAARHWQEKTVLTILGELEQFFSGRTDYPATPEFQL